MTEMSWSKYYDVEVTFLSGSELNTATNSFSYSSYNIYAVIFWGSNQSSVIKLTATIYSGTVSEMTISSACMMGNLKGIDQDGDDWEICTSMICY